MTFNGYIQRIFSKGSFGNDALTLLIGNVLAQAVLICGAPILTRLYSAADFGFFALFVSIVNIISAGICWRYELAIMLPDNEKDAISLLGLSLSIAALMTFGYVILLLLFQDKMIGQFGHERFRVWLFLSPVALIFTGVERSFLFWSVRRKFFVNVAAYKISDSLICIVIQITVFFILALREWGLIVGYLFGQIAGVLILIFTAILKSKMILLKEKAIFNFQNMRAQFLKHKHFPFFSLPGSFFNQAVLDVPNLILAYFFNTEVVGFFSLGRRVLGSPISMIGEAISRVFYQKASNMKNKGKDVHVLISKVIIALFFLSVVPMAILFFTSSRLFAIVFGAKWVEAGRYVQLLIPLYIMKFVVSPISQTNLIYGKQKEGFLWQAAFFIISIICITAGCIANNVSLAIVLYSASGAIMYLLFIFLALHWSNGDFSQLAQVLSKIYANKK